MAISASEIAQITEQQMARDSVIAGLERAWPEPDLNETIQHNGKASLVSSLGTLPQLGQVKNALLGEISALSRALGVKIKRGDSHPSEPVSTAELDPVHRARARKLNLLSLQMRAVELRADHLIAATAAQERARRERHLMTLQEVVEKVPLAMRARAQAVGNLHERAARVALFIEDLNCVAVACSRHKIDADLRELVKKAATVIGEETPEMPQDSLPSNLDATAAAKLAALMGATYSGATEDAALIARGQAALRELGAQ